jgi:hypothetical protein
LNANSIRLVRDFQKLASGERLREVRKNQTGLNKGKPGKRFGVKISEVAQKVEEEELSKR